MSYIVTAPYITAPSASQSQAVAAQYPQLVGWPTPAQTITGRGPRIKPTEVDPISGFLNGVTLPADVPSSSITFLLARGLIALV
jgi:hypothetical protein